MTTRTLDDFIDALHAPGSPERAAFDRGLARAKRINSLTGWVYQTLVRIPPKWPTWHDSDGRPQGYVGVGPVAAQFWSDVLDQSIYAVIDRYSPKDVVHNVLDGLAWRFFDDVYVPTIGDVRAGHRRLHWPRSRS